MADTIQDVKKTGMRGIIGARWLVGGQRLGGYLPQQNRLISCTGRPDTGKGPGTLASSLGI